ncbi:right-handed parallel beta-helix repeat-containing protein [Streptomyces anandii]|uniref:right-handed parallel beta-helix repeat-containing protein n=1 Tax=Streptomyces anandii TaxID=285454 RepID=UPI0036745415
MSVPLTADAREHGLTGDGVTNDQPALQRLVDAMGAARAADGCPRVIRVPAGRYVIQDVPTVWRGGVSLIGAGRGATCFVLRNPGARTTPVPLAWFTAAQHDAGPDNHLSDVTFAHFEIDGAGVTTEEYDPLAKGLGLQYVLRGRFSDLYVHDTAATGFGCDFLQDTVVEGVLAQRCGRQDSGEQMGGAGIGIGVGGWGRVERLTVTACTATGNGTNGVFVELQNEEWPRPRGIRITACHAEDNRFGISDWGADGLLVTSCTMLGNHEAGFDVSSQGTSGTGGRGGIVTGCVIDGNLRDGIGLGNTPGPYAFHGNRISNNGRTGTGSTTSRAVTSGRPRTSCWRPTTSGTTPWTASGWTRPCGTRRSWTTGSATTAAGSPGRSRAAARGCGTRRSPWWTRGPTGRRTGTAARRCRSAGGPPWWPSTPPPSSRWPRPGRARTPRGRTACPGRARRTGCPARRTCARG